MSQSYQPNKDERPIKGSGYSAWATVPTISGVRRQVKLNSTATSSSKSN